jgi:hypothetical protein
MALDVTTWAQKLEIPFVVDNATLGTFAGKAEYVLQYKVENQDKSLDWPEIGLLKLELKWDIKVLAPAPAPTSRPTAPPIPTSSFQEVELASPKDPDAGDKPTFEWKYPIELPSSKGETFRLVAWRIERDATGIVTSEAQSDDQLMCIGLCTGTDTDEDWKYVSKKFESGVWKYAIAKSLEFLRTNNIQWAKWSVIVVNKEGKRLSPLGSGRIIRYPSGNGGQPDCQGNLCP